MRQTRPAVLTRRGMLAGSIAGVGFGLARAASPLSRRLTFTVWREKQKIGLHSLIFSGDDRDFEVLIDAAMSVSIGPLRLFQYHHQAAETWRVGQFSALTSHTVTNGRSEQLSATRESAGVVVKTLMGAHVLPADTLPLTHWNQKALAGPLFNPETGAPMHERVSHSAGQFLRSDGRAVLATSFSLSGDAEITDWYDADGVWSALRAKAKDGSLIEYQRIA
jgi:hypothetical protein